MKKYYYVLIIFLLVYVFLILPTVNAKTPLYNKTIVIDPGHGDKDPGTSEKGILEKDINLAISLELYEILKEYGANIILTRTTDYDLSSPNAYHRKRSDFDNRIKIINESNADMYLSIHLNYLNNSLYYGPQIFYDQKNEKLANHFQTIMNEELIGNRKSKRIPNNTYMYSKLKVKGLLIECGFLSNEKERSLLITKEYQKKIASSIAKALIEYY